MATTYLTRTFGTPTNASKWTVSVWCKKQQTTGTQPFIHAWGGHWHNFANVGFGGDRFFYHTLHSRRNLI